MVCNLLSARLFTMNESISLKKGDIKYFIKEKRIHLSKCSGGNTYADRLNNPIIAQIQLNIPHVKQIQFEDAVSTSVPILSFFSILSDKSQ